MKDTTKDTTKDIARTDVAIPAPSPKEGDHHPRPDTLEVGQWYWVRREKRDKEETTWTFCCLVHLGSNFAKLESPPRGEYKHVDRFRVHFENFFDDLIWVPNAQEVIDGYLSHHHSNLHLLMREMKEVTARLAIAPSRELHAADTETQALSTTLSGQSYGDYKGALIKARDKELPAIFKAIKAEHAELAMWMSAQLVPMEAEAAKLSKITDSIRSRIFNVELYAGLVEVIEQVKDGDPPDLTTPITLLQRRHYMDEECLAHYETGGMQFRHIRAFDRWIAREDNMRRLLPFPRCILAFRVRRYNIEREVNGLSDFFQLMQEQKEDRRTFLYIRNGGQLFRMSTRIDFGEHLFPDIARETLGGVKLWAKHSDGHVEDLITDHDYQERVKAWNERVARNEENRKKWEADKAAWEATADKKERKENGYKWNWYHEDTGLHFDEERFQPFDKTSVYYDDIKKYVQDQIDAHNRIALVLQGLLDRSPVLHPHPPWQLWTEEGAGQALRLIHDDSRALTPGEAPDFEAYRAKLNASIKPGSVTIGQHTAWQEAEAEKWNEKNPDRDRRWRYTPHENPGPGRLATVVKKRGDKVFYEWTRKSNKGTKRWVPNPNRPGWGHHTRDYADVTSTFSCPTKEVFNVSAYQQGDFKQFFNDPRTRANYVAWAPFLLTAEEWHAGNLDGKPREKPWTCDGCKKLSADYDKPCACGVKRWWRDDGGVLQHCGKWPNERGSRSPSGGEWPFPYDVEEAPQREIVPKREDEDDDSTGDESDDEDAEESEDVEGEES
jgi:hypothetical protein